MLRTFLREHPVLTPANMLGTFLQAHAVHKYLGSRALSKKSRRDHSHGVKFDSIAEISARSRLQICSAQDIPASAHCAQMFGQSHIVVCAAEPHVMH